MKVLNIYQTQIISGGSEGIYYFEGESYPIQCPSVSQICLDSYISYSGNSHPSVTGPSATIVTVMNNCKEYGREMLRAGYCVIDLQITQINLLLDKRR